ncbi:unnamed protein product [Arctogadus glacialis]
MSLVVSTRLASTYRRSSWFFQSASLPRPLPPKQQPRTSLPAAPGRRPQDAGNLHPGTRKAGFFSSFMKRSPRRPSSTSASQLQQTSPRPPQRGASFPRDGDPAPQESHHRAEYTLPRGGQVATAGASSYGQDAPGGLFRFNLTPAPHQEDWAAGLATPRSRRRDEGHGRIITDRPKANVGCCPPPGPPLGGAEARPAVGVASLLATLFPLHPPLHGSNAACDGPAAGPSGPSPQDRRSLKPQAPSLLGHLHDGVVIVVKRDPVLSPGTLSPTLPIPCLRFLRNGGYVIAHS